MAINEIASQPWSSLLRIRYFTRSSRAQHTLSERSTRGRMPWDACLSPPNAKSSSGPSPGGELDTSETWSRICYHNHCFFNLILSVLYRTKITLQFCYLWSKCILTELRPRKCISKLRAWNRNIEMTFTIKNPIDSKALHAIDPYHLNGSLCNLVIIGQFAECIDWILTIHFLDISLSLPVPVDQAWVLNQIMTLKSFFG